MPVLPIILTIFVSMGRVLALFGRATYTAWKDEQTRGTVYITFVVVLSGTIVFHFVEQWSWLDAFYFTIITLTTVGYGDISPHTDLGKLFTVVYIIVGLGILASFISSIAQNANINRNGFLLRKFTNDDELEND